MKKNNQLLMIGAIAVGGYFLLKSQSASAGGYSGQGQLPSGGQGGHGGAGGYSAGGGSGMGRFVPMGRARFNQGGR